MATTTTNLGLKKPALTDDALISDINDNMDDLDSVIGAVPSGTSLYTAIGNEQKLNYPNVKVDATTSSINFNEHTGNEIIKFASDSIAANSQNRPSGWAGAFCSVPINGTDMRNNWANGYQIYINRKGLMFLRGIETDGSGNTTFGGWGQLATTPTLYEDSISSYSLPSGQEPTVLSTTLLAGTYLVSVHLTWDTTSCGRYIRVDGNNGNEIRVQDNNWTGHESTVSGIVKTTGALSLRLYQNSGSSMTVNVASFRAVRLI